MKRQTYNILTHIPILNVIVKYVICDPSVYSSQFRDDGLYEAITEYRKQHPDEQITRKVLKNIMNK